MTRSMFEKLGGRVPWGLLGAIALIAAVEKHAIDRNPAFMSAHVSSWTYAAKNAARKAVGREILCFGDSQVKFGMLPSVLKALTGRSGFNLAATVGSAPTSYFLLRRVLESGGKPRAVIVDFNPGIQKVGPGSNALGYPWADLLTPGETLDLAWTARDADLLGRIAIGRVFPSCRWRYEIRAHVVKLLKGERTESGFFHAVTHRNWNRNEGAQAHMKTEFAELPPLPRTAPRKGRWQCDPVNQEYIRRFLALASNRGIQVYWLLAPLCPRAQDHLEFRGDDARFTAFVRQTQQAFPELVVIDARRPGLDRSYFIDDRHLDRDGAAAITAAVGEVVLRRAQGERSGWVALADVGRPPVEVAVEDVGQSILGIRAMGARVRR